MKTLEMTIDGMSCGHCVMAIKKALSKVPGVSVQSVDIGRAVLTIEAGFAGEQALTEAVAEAGYSVTAVARVGAA